MAALASDCAYLEIAAFQKAAVDTEAWRPEQAGSLHPPRPDKSVKPKAAHEAAELKRVLDERIARADAQGAIWHDAEDVFDELTAAHVGYRESRGATHESPLAPL